MAPYLFFGLTIAGVLHVFFDRAFIIKHLGKANLASVVKASILGVPIPLCSCGVIPTAISLRKHKASQGATVSFLISTPQTGVDSIVATYGMLGPVFAVFRPIVSFVMGIIGGIAVNLLGGKDQGRAYGHQHEHNSEKNCAKCDHELKQEKERKTVVQRFKTFFSYAYFEFLDDLSVNLVIGIIIAGIISFVIPEDFFAANIQNEFISMLLMIAVGIPLYICATASIPVAVALILKGLSPGAAFVFLAVGPATNAATMTMIVREMGRNIFTIYLVTIATFSIIAGYVLNFLFEFLGMDSLNLMAHAHVQETNIFIQIISWLFVLFLVLSLIRRLKKLIKV